MIRRSVLASARQFWKSRDFILQASRSPLKQVTLTDEYGPVNFYLMPFAPGSGRLQTTGGSGGLSCQKSWMNRERNALITHFCNLAGAGAGAFRRGNKHSCGRH